MTEESNKNQRVYLYGASSDRRTKSKRRTHAGPNPKQLRLGTHRNVVVRRGRRVAVSPAWFRTMGVAEQVMSYFNQGHLLVVDGSGKALSEEELLSLCEMEAPEIEEEESTEGGEEGNASEENDDESADEKEESGASDLSSSDAEGEEGNQEDSESVDDDASEEEDTDASAEDDTDVAIQFPEGWETSTKKELIALAAELGIDLPEGATKTVILETMMAVEQG